MKRAWTTVAKDHNGTPEQRERLAGMFDRLEWIAIEPGGLSLPMMVGEGLKECIRELRIPKPSHIAYTNEMAPFGLMAVRGHYKNGMAQVYLCDEGCNIAVLCSDFWPNDAQVCHVA